MRLAEAVLMAVVFALASPLKLELDLGTVEVGDVVGGLSEPTIKLPSGPMCQSVQMKSARSDGMRRHFIRVASMCCAI